MKMARTVLSGGEDGGKFKVLPIATITNKKSACIYALLVK
ncbi:hypothetical protein bthur0010_60090 [Bacillus thuringiensis serovar pondicheriensis BGSC 4BA1]|nr:hypothetical protein bthur0010_60090 [Bacillus thuringiensis serovar pondicheriensis BGSC 4BA1]